MITPEQITTDLRETLRGCFMQPKVYQYIMEVCRLRDALEAQKTLIQECIDVTEEVIDQVGDYRNGRWKHLETIKVRLQDQLDDLAREALGVKDK